MCHDGYCEKLSLSLAETRLNFVKLCKVHIDPPLKPFKDPLCGCTTQLSVVDKLAEGVINPMTSQIWWIAA